MRTEIYIEDNRLDLYKDISAEFTYNIDDVKDFSSRNTNFSKTIVIPGNAINNKLFGHIFEFGNANFYNSTQSNVGYNFNAAKSAACIVYVDKIQIFKGVIRLLEIVIDNGIEYECAVFGELGGFVSAVGNNKLENLDFSAYNHVWSKDNIVNSWNQASGTTASGMGYFYPLIDYGQVSHNNKLNFEVGAFRPALFVREYMKKIIEGAGYTWESTFFDSNLFKRLVIPNNQKELSSYASTAFNADITLKTYNSTGVGFGIEFGNINQLGSFTSSLSNTRFTYNGATTLNTTLALSVTGLWNTSAPGAVLLKKNGTEIHRYTIGSGGAFYYFTATFSEAVSFATNDYFEIYMEVNGGVSHAYILTTQAGNVTLNVANQLVALNLGETIKINDTIPRGIFQKDFFSSIIKMFNLYVTESTDKSKHLIITPFIDYYNFANTINWTSKVDRSKPFRIKPMSELNGRYFEYKYKTDSDFYNDDYYKKFAQSYGDYIEDTGYEFANEKQTAEVIFASSPLIGYAGTDKVMVAIYKKSNTQNTESEDTMDSIIRIMQVRKITGVSNWHIKDTGGGNIGGHLNDYGYAGHLDDPDAPAADINFGSPKQIYFTLATTYASANLFNGYWSDYVAEISDKDSKLLTCNVYLNDVDIYNLDFSKPIYIDGALWRLNKIMDYNPMVQDTTKCEFLKVIETTYA